MVLHWQDVKALHAQGKTDAEIAAIYDVTPRYVGQTRASIGLKSINRRRRQ